MRKSLKSNMMLSITASVGSIANRTALLMASSRFCAFLYLTRTSLAIIWSQPRQRKEKKRNRQELIPGERRAPCHSESPPDRTGSGFERRIQRARVECELWGSRRGAAAARFGVFIETSARAQDQYLILLIWKRTDSSEMKDNDGYYPQQTFTHVTVEVARFFHLRCFLINRQSVSSYG